MLTATLFFLAAKIIFFLRVLAPFLQKSDRQTQKIKLISALTSLKKMELSEIATIAINLADKTFNAVGGRNILSVCYIARCSLIGFSLGVIFSFFALVFIATDFSQAINIVQKKYWWHFIFLPTVLTATILAPIDIACAHLLVRWGARGQRNRAYLALLAGLPLAYTLWAIGAGLATMVGLFISSKFFMPSFVWNRIVVAFFNPIQSSASFQLGPHWFSYGLLAASSALSSLLVSVIFLFAAILKTSPERLQIFLAKPIFLALDLLNFLDRKKINLPIQIFSWSFAIILLISAIIFHMLGFD